MNEFMVLYVIINNTKGLLFVMDNTKKANRYTWPICGAIVLIVSIFFCYLCYKYSIIACGIIIVTSVVLINIMLWLLEIRNIKLEEETIEFIRGDIEKRSHCQIETDFGVFTYRDVPASAYPEQILLKEENGYSYQIATPEKALCDKLYTLSPLNNYSNLKRMLFNDLRIDEETFNKLSADTIFRLSKLYHSTNIDLLARYMKKIKRNNIKE